MATVVDKGGSPFRKPAADLWMHISYWVLVLLAVLITYGVFVMSQPGDRILQIAFAVAVLPPLVIGLFAAGLFRRQGKPMSLGMKTIWLVGVSGITIPLAGLVMIYLVIVAIQQTCFPAR